MTRPVYSSTICTFPPVTMYLHITVEQVERAKRLPDEFLTGSTHDPQARESRGELEDPACALEAHSDDHDGTLPLSRIRHSAHRVDRGRSRRSTRSGRYLSTRAKKEDALAEAKQVIHPIVLRAAEFYFDGKSPCAEAVALAV